MSNFFYSLAEDWFNLYIKNTSWLKLVDLKDKFCVQFGARFKGYIIARLWDNLKQTGTVDEYVTEHERIQLLAHINISEDEGIVKYFTKNLQ